MKSINDDNVYQMNDRILHLLEDIHSTLDLYYESDADKDNLVKD